VAVIKGGLIGLLLAALLAGAGKKPPESKAANEAVEIGARVFTDRKEIRELLGHELESSIAVVELRLVPKDGRQIEVNWDDFLLISNKNGKRSTPFAPSQVAGSAALVISSRGGGGVAMQNEGPVWGPPMGGRPERIGGDGATIGNTGATTQSMILSGGNTSKNPLLDLLEERVLPQKKSAEPVSGLLYFYLEGKHKPRDVELTYASPSGKLVLRFRD